MTCGVIDDGVDEEKPLSPPPHAAKNAALRHTLTVLRTLEMRMMRIYFPTPAQRAR